MSALLISSPPLASLRESSSGRQTVYSFNSKVMVAAMAILFIVVVFVVSLHIYAKWFWRRGASMPRWSTSARALNMPWQQHWRRSRLDVRTEGSTITDVRRSVGLDAATVNSLPTFVYTGAESHDADPLLECAVCLSEFQVHDRGRTLPNCKHSFHIHCIDMWFRSHATCPLCRAAVLPSPGQELLPGASLRDHPPASLHHSALPATTRPEHHEDPNTLSARRGFHRLFLLQSSGASVAPLEIDQEPASPHLLPSLASRELHPRQESEGFPSHARTASPARTHIPAASAWAAQIPLHEELIHGDDASQVILSGMDARESSLIWPDNLRQDERVRIARSASLSFSRSASEDAQTSLAQPQKSSSFRMSIKWLVSRELSRGRTRVFPSGKVHGQPEQSASNTSLPV